MEAVRQRARVALVGQHHYRRARQGFPQLMDILRKLGDLAAQLDADQLRRVVLVEEVELGNAAHRSEEHTSELQSLMHISYAVFCSITKRKHSHKLHNTHD